MINYKIVKRGQPGVAGGGTQKYYASPLYSGDIDVLGIARKLSGKSTLTRTDIVAVISGLVDLVAEELADGKVVRLGNLGTFRISLSSRGEDTAEEVNSNSIRSSKVLFRPASFFEETLGTLKFEKAKDLIVNPDDIPPAEDETLDAA